MMCIQSEAMPRPVPRPTLGLQRRLTVNAPRDRYEQEADRAADSVVLGRGRPSLSARSPGALQREDDKKKEPPTPLGEGLTSVGKNLGENNPPFSLFSEKLATRFLAQPAPISVSVPAFLGANYAFLWGMALIDPAMRRSFDDFNLAMLPGLVPQFPVKTFQYRILDGAQTRFAFDIGLDASKLMLAFNEGVLNTRVSSLKFDTSGKLDTSGPKPLAFSALQVQLGLFGDGVLLSGGFRNGISPYPLMGDDGARVMAQTPALPDLYANQRDVRFTLQLDLLKLASHFGAPAPVPRAPERLQREASDAGALAPTADAAVQATLAGAGAPLDAATRGFMELRFGHSFSRVRIHADGTATASAQAVHARAYTLGHDIVFGAGQYAPSTGAGRRLLAHELAHVVQQQGTAILVQRDDDAAERKKQEAERARAQKRLEDWAQKKDPKPSTDPTSKDFAFTAQELAHDITHAGQTDLLGKPKNRVQLKNWQTTFRDAYQLALMILDSTGTEQRESRAAMIAMDLANAGFATEAMSVAARLPTKQQQFIYTDVAGMPESATADHLRTVSAFSVGEHRAPSEHLLLSRLTDRSGAYATRLDKGKLLAALAPTLAAYKADPKYVEMLAQLLVFHTPGRVPISDWLWKKDKAFMFQVLDSSYLVEPGYGGSQFADANGKPRVLTMQDDMPWVYTYKQKYYVDYLVQLGAEQGVAIPAPADLRFATLRAWLQAQTGPIAQALANKYPKAPEQKAAVYQHIADIFFFHVERGDVVPDLSGALGRLGAADPNAMRLRADCDVLAIYATRLLRGSGFRAVGYLAVVPEGGQPGHAVALLAHAETDGPAKAPPPGVGQERYHIVNNKQVTPSKAATQEAAIKAALTDALAIYVSPPESFRVYYENATATGAMTQALWTTQPTTYCADLSQKALPSTP